MVGHLTVCIGPAQPGAGVRTLVAHAGQRIGAVRVDGALGLALHIGIALKARQAGAGRSTVAIATLGVDTAGRGSAGVNYLGPRRCCCKWGGHS